MNISLAPCPKDFKSFTSQVLVLFSYSVTDKALKKLCETLSKEGDLNKADASQVTLHTPQGFALQRLIVVQQTGAERRQWAKQLSSGIKAAKATGAKKIHLLIPDAEIIDLVVQMIEKNEYCYEATLSKKPEKSSNQWVLLLNDLTSAKSKLSEALGVAHGIRLTKELGNLPANYCTPSHLAKTAQGIGKKAKFSCEVLDYKQILALKMGAFASVTQGSEEPAKFIVLKYQGASKQSAPYVLVGKGITFDTGGISIKPSAAMDEMKFDMCGAASVIGCFEALSHVKPKCNVIGLIPSCENMPGRKATKPGDVVTSMAGKTIEILNTDAEGRLILCDALHYAKRFKPAAVIDIATLTGACVVALGSVHSGLFSNDETLAQELLKLGETSLDTCWRLPLGKEYAESLNSNFADLSNIPSAGSRNAGSTTAACFLEHFTEGMRWAHLDIAGTAWMGSGSQKGATGRPVALLMSYLLAHAEV